MTRSNRLREILFTASLIGSLFLASCSQEPGSGPLSPSNAVGKRREANTNVAPAANTVRPVQRLAQRSLSKSGYNVAKVQQDLQTVYAEIKGIVDKRPGWWTEAQLNDVLKEIHEALLNLQKSPADDNGALSKIAKAKSEMQEAIYRRILPAAHGAQFIAQLAEIETQVQNGTHASGDYRGQKKSLWIKRSYGGFIGFGGHSIDVPKYAAKYDAQFFIDISRNDYITVDFGPDGWFDQQVTVTISYADADLTGIDPSKLTLAWFDESAGQWIDHGGTVDLIKKTVTAKAWHFTQYTISAK